jgi:outer membrane receptor protein involved in Fe transport
MTAQRSVRTGRSLTFISALMLSTAIAAPAFAQMEVVVVTAEKKTEDVQTVPIAIAAFTSQDLKAQQITKFSDLQFAAPNVTYSEANFTGANFQIRGIGITAVGGGAESGVAVNYNDVFLAAPPTDGASFFDLQDVEVLRGPQSTLYGRGATGGTVNITPNKPDLDTASVTIDSTYGNYNALEIMGDANVPLVPGELGLRIAGDFQRRDGFTTNIADNFHQNDRNQYSVRGSLRWEPTSHTTIDFMVEADKENDARGRANKELCAPDPTGVLGCTPASPQTGALNLNATYLNILASKQGIEGALGPAIGFTYLAGLGANPGFQAIPGASAELVGFETAALSGGNVPALLAALPPGLATFLIKSNYGTGFGTGLGLGSLLGLTDTSVPFVAPPNSNPSSLWKVNDDFNPINRSQGIVMTGEWKQYLTSWLDGTFVAGTTQGSVFNEQSYTNTFGPALGAVNLGTAEFVFLNDVVGNPAFGGSPALAAAYAPFFSHAGELPVSNFTGLGISSGSVNRYSPNLSSNDQANGNSSQYSGELRFNSKFDGPFNFLLGGYYLNQTSQTNYFVASNSLDYASIILGGLTSAIGGLPAGLIGPSYYHNIGRKIDLTSKSIFGEVYYDIMPDLLKITLGGRYTSDAKSEDARIGVLSGYSPIGASNERALLDRVIPFQTSAPQCNSATPPVCVPGNGSIQSGTFNSDTGRAVIDWTPKLDFTDQTLVYLSYARGYKAGGFNPGLQAGNTGSGLSPTYGPETIDAYELGTKNNALDGHLQVNADFWYYNYQGLQVSAIIDNTSINQNIAAKLWGVEGELVYLPIDNLQFNVNTSWTHSGIVGTSEVDQRNPTGGYARAILIKDNTLGPAANQNCVIYDNNPGAVTLPTGYTFVPAPSGPQLAQFVAPPGGQTSLASTGVPNVAFGSCSPSAQLKTFLAAQGYSETQPSVGGTFTGVPVSLNGNELQQTPNLTLSAGGQYTFDMGGGYTLVPRADYYWQSHMWGRIFHDPADLIKSWDVANALLTFNAPQGAWYVGAYVKNIFNKTYVTGEYLTSSSSGLYTNAFLGDPRTFGVQAGIHF